jgi:hypothetical protein
MVAMEELLIIDDGGRFENRMMGFLAADPEECSGSRRCSDAPLIATGRFTLARRPAGLDVTLSIEDYRAVDNLLDTPAVDPVIRAAAVSSTRLWPVSRIDTAEGVLVLHKGSGHETRTFFRIEPDRLRRLRAGLREAELSASQHWRCWIAAATGAARPSPGLRAAAVLPPAIDSYIRIASYVQTADAQVRRRTADDPDPAQRKFADVAVEALLNERFDSLPPPKTTSDRRHAAFVASYLRLVAEGKTPDAATAELRRYDPQFQPPKEFSTSEVAALALARSDSAEAKGLFCKP